MNIKEYVYNYRKEHSLSMQAFGDMCGLSRAYISILEKGINPTTGKPFIPTIDTLKKIAEVTGTDLDSLLKMLDDSQPVIVNIPPAPMLQLTDQEKSMIKKYRQLNADGKLVIDNQIDFMLYQQGQSAEKEEQSLG
jgi:transcriptional regulator with XRE-family HTH domain